MGSLGGAAVGALLLGLTTQLLGRLPAVELHVLLDHLHVRPRRDRARRAAARALREAGMRRAVTPDRVVGVAALVVAVLAPLLFSTYWVGALLTQMLFLGIVAASLIFLSAYGGMVSLAQVAIYGIAGFVARQRDDERQHEGAQPRLEPVVGRPASAIAIAVGVGAALRRAREPQRRDLLPDDHADVLGDREPVLRPGDRRLRASAGSAASRRRASIGNVDAHPNRLYYVALVVRARRLRCCCATSCGRRSG